MLSEAALRIYDVPKGELEAANTPSFPRHPNAGPDTKCSEIGGNDWKKITFFSPPPGERAATNSGRGRAQGPSWRRMRLNGTKIRKSCFIPIRGLPTHGPLSDRLMLRTAGKP